MLAFGGLALTPVRPLAGMSTHALRESNGMELGAEPQRPGHPY
jgi:hypothetical protein